MLSVTKINIEFKFYWYKHMNRRYAPLMRSLTAKWFSGSLKWLVSCLQCSYLMTT